MVMDFKRINMILSVFWLLASIGIIYLDVKQVISLTRNTGLFFGVVIVMFLSFQVVKIFEKRASQK
ncbi:hypothetical protein HMPREF9402_1344 [Turicibacter sp. HGF1]|nr:hypothetical protein HMPREF9402_1344 [Turicibacter sp. HGF1]